MTTHPFPSDLHQKIDALINENRTEHPILQITQYYDERYIILWCDQDDGAEIHASLIKLDSQGNPFYEQDFGHWTF